MATSNSLLAMVNGVHSSRMWQTALALTAWSIGSCVTAEFLGYWLHRLLHSGWIAFLSRSHMKHHMILYGPLQKQRSPQYHDATNDSLSLGNIGLEWLVPAALLIGVTLTVLHYLRVRLVYEFVFLGVTLAWSVLMFSYLHDVMHVEDVWLEKNKWLRRWFAAARRLHDIHHHVINDEGLMDANFGIGFFFFDRLFGTFAGRGARFNHRGYEAARRRIQSMLNR